MAAPKPFRFTSPVQVDIPTTDLITFIFDSQTYSPHKPIYHDALDPSRTLSSSQSRSTIRKLIAGLKHAGLQPGECVVIHSFNDIMYSMLVLAIIGAGGIFTGTNPSYTTHELSHHIRSSKAQCIISEPEILKAVVEAGKENGIGAEKVWIFDNLPGQEVPKGMRSYKELLTKGESDWVRFDDEERCKSTIMGRLFSSGTTGLPKAAQLSHHNFIAQQILVEELVTLPYEKRVVVPTPSFHIAAAPRTHISALRLGIHTVILRRFELELFLKTIQDHKVTELGVIPPIAVAIIMSPLTKKYDFSSIRSSSSGAAPMALGPQQRLRALVPKGVRFGQVWGMTETTCIATMFPYPEDDNTASVGYYMPTLTGKLIDDDGNDISGYDVRGEMCVKGPTVFPGYFENPKANAESFDEEGFFKTGDIGYCDSKTKKWYIVDRKKELIKVRGFQVAPPELEGILLTHPAIVDAAVVGVWISDEVGEAPRAYVVKRPGHEITDQEVRAWVAERVAKYKQLTEKVVFIDAIPKNPTGKILKRILREWIKEEKRADGPKL